MKQKNKRKRLTLDERAWRADVAWVIVMLVLIVTYMLVGYQVGLKYLGAVWFVFAILMIAFNYLMRWVANVPIDHNPYDTSEQLHK